jgi:GxxExxY protein
MSEEYKYSDITQKIIGCAMKVHGFLGNGFQEVIYQRALALELASAGLNFQREVEQEIFYRDYSESIGDKKV